MTVSAVIRPDNMLVAIGLDKAEHIAVLSSRLHVTWALSTGGWLGVGNDPRYSKSRTFDPFPFPVAVDLSGASGNPLFAQQERLRSLGERLDSFRKQRLAEHSFLTMTGIYNALERFREVENGFDVPPLTHAERRAPSQPDLCAKGNTRRHRSGCIDCLWVGRPDPAACRQTGRNTPILLQEPRTRREKS